MAGMWKPGEYEEFIGVKGKRIVATKLVSRTHFKKGREAISDTRSDWQWRWTTKTPDEVDIVGVGGEGYDRIHGALNGFFSQQGIPGWQPNELGQTLFENIPDGYELQKIADDHYVVLHYTNEGE